jgi:cbb3-type cytochrome oxidase subunit 3
MWVIFIYCLLSIGFDIYLSSSMRAYEHRFLIWNIFAILEYTLITYFFYLVIDSRLIRFLIIVLSLFYLVIFILYSKSNKDQFNSIVNAFGSVIFLILSLCYFIIALKPTDIPVTNIFTPRFLIVVALLLYVASTLFLYIIVNKLSEKEMLQYWILNTYSGILTSLIISIAFVVFKYQRNQPPFENRQVDFTSPNDR